MFPDKTVRCSRQCNEKTELVLASDDDPCVRQCVSKNIDKRVVEQVATLE